MTRPSDFPSKHRLGVVNPKVLRPVVGSIVHKTTWLLALGCFNRHLEPSTQVYSGVPPVYRKKQESVRLTLQKNLQFPGLRGSNCCSQKLFHVFCWSKYVYFFLLVKYRVFLTYSTTSLAQMPIFLIQVRHHFYSSKPNVSWYFLSCCCLQNSHSIALTTSLCLLVVDYRDNYPQNANVHHFLWLNNVI